MELTRLTRAEKALAHATAGVTRARERQGRKWGAWVEATGDVRKAQEIEAEARREARAAKAEEAASVNRGRETNETMEE